MKRAFLFLSLAIIGISGFAQETGTMKDKRDKQVYETVKIGEQVWFAENLNYEMPNSWCYRDSAKYCDLYGRLYTYESALKACPKGWHLPSDDEWKTLEKELGMTAEEADQFNYRGNGIGLKLRSQTDWYFDEIKSQKGTNESGFTALGGGYRIFQDGSCSYAGMIGSWWTSTAQNDKGAWSRYLSHNFTSVFRKAYNKGDAYSVRCLKD